MNISLFRICAYRALFVCLGLAIHLSAGLGGLRSAAAHDEFKEPMERRYKLKSISCKACHTDSKDKKIRNAFGKLLHEELKEKELTRHHEEAKEKGDEEKAKYEKEMVKHFIAALEVVEKKKLTFAALLDTGLLNGTRLDSDKVDVASLKIKLLDAKKSGTQAKSDPDRADKKEASPPESAPVIEGEIKSVPEKPEVVEPAKKPEAAQPQQAPSSGSGQKEEAASAKPAPKPVVPTEPVKE